MSDLARLRIWDDQAVRAALSRYLDVAENPAPSQVPVLPRRSPRSWTLWQAARTPAPDGPHLCALEHPRLGSIIREIRDADQKA